jgi:hypothetical protein
VIVLSDSQRERIGKWETFPILKQIVDARLAGASVTKSATLLVLCVSRVTVSKVSNIVVQYSVDPIITLHGRITAREYMDKLGNHVHSMIQTLFPNNDAVFPDDNAPIHTAGTVQSWFEERKGELQHLPWPAQSPDLNITELFWSVLETRVRNRFPPQTSLKQLDALQQE